MKKMKKIQAIVTATLLTLVMVSCLDNTDDMYATMETTETDFATVILPGSDAVEATIENDNGQHAYLVNPEILKEHDANYEGQRILHKSVGVTSPNPTSSKSPYIRIIALQKILTKGIDILKTDEEDEYGHNGIHPIGYRWSSKHLTFQFQIRTSGGSHRISLVMSEGDEVDAEGYLTLDLRHHAGDNQPVSLSQPTYVSFCITDVPGFAEGTLKGFRIRYIDIENKPETLVIVPASKSMIF